MGNALAILCLQELLADALRQRPGSGGGTANLGSRGKATSQSENVKVQGMHLRRDLGSGVRPTSRSQDSRSAGNQISRVGGPYPEVRTTPQGRDSRSPGNRIFRPEVRATSQGKGAGKAKPRREDPGGQDRGKGQNPGVRVFRSGSRGTR